MPKLIVFNNITVDGYFTDANGDMSWAYRAGDDPEWNAFVSENAKGGGRLLLGRITYEMMASYWPTPLAAETSPSVAEGMNRMPKVVFSRTLDTASWSNTRVAKDAVAEVLTMKTDSGEDMAILGSGSIVAELAPEGLIDEFQFVVNPVVLGAGRTMFDGIADGLSLTLTKSRAFRNGNVLLCYEPAKRA
jgi:dihydrofolate reductase